MADGITLYDVLGVTAGASVDTLRYAYDARLLQLRPDLSAGAPSPVVAAVSRAREAVEMSWLVLSDAELRREYDKAIGLHRRGLRGSSGFAEGALHYGGDPYDPMRAAERLIDRDVLSSFTALLRWMAPLPAQRKRHLIAPDLRGLFYRPCQAAATMAGLRLDVIRLTGDPQPVEGLVVAQSPEPGTRVRRQSTLTVQVWHPPQPRVGGPTVPGGPPAPLR